MSEKEGREEKLERASKLDRNSDMRAMWLSYDEMVAQIRLEVEAIQKEFAEDVRKESGELQHIPHWLDVIPETVEEIKDE